nr:abhydrolase domain-containing protein mpah [Quercus suber]
MASPFIIREHIFAGQHIREYSRALASSQEDVIRLHAKSYTPREVDDGSASGDLTIIAWHANAFTKELYEPLFEALYQRLKDSHGLIVRSIWIADQAAQGSSALLNDDKAGNDPAWFDHSRDVIAMANAFRQHMVRPIVGLGHSMGATQAVGTAHFHPRLFEALVLIDPALTSSFAPTIGAMLGFAFSKPDAYASRQDAETAVRRNPLFKTWDPRVVQRYLDTAFHTAPTTAIPDGRVKPKTTPAVEASSLTRANPDHLGVAHPLTDVERALHPNLDPAAPLTGPVQNPHTRIAWSWLPSLRPATFYLLGAGSQVCPRDELAARTQRTGIDVGGSGGGARVAARTIPGGHFLPMTNVPGTADAVALWLADHIRWYRRREAELHALWAAQPRAQKQQLSPRTLRVLRDWDGKPWAKPERGSEEEVEAEETMEKSRL